MGIDIRMIEIGVFGVFILEYIEGHNDHADVFANLGSCQSDAFASIHGFKHILNEFRQFGIIWRNVLCHFAQYGLTVSVDR